MRIKAKFDIRPVLNTLTEAKAVPEEVMTTAFKTFVKETPVATGNARRNTYLEREKLTINAAYTYAQRLDQGWSRQSPKGMTEPTIQEIEKLVNEKYGRL